MVQEVLSFGTLSDPASLSGVISHQSTRLQAQSLNEFWRRCSLTSDFWARYLSLSFPTQAAPGELDRGAAESSLSYLLNELVENCAKFSRGPVGDVELSSWLLEDRLEVRVVNHIVPEQVASFETLIHELLEQDPEELYFQKLEANAEDESKGSGLGYLTLIKDYGVRFGFRFTPVGTSSVRVEVHAQLKRKEND